MKNEITILQFIKSYWNYYLELEEQLIQTKRFVDFDISNYKTFSIEYLKLLQATCSEIDVVAKIIAEKLDPTFSKLDNKNIQKWGFVIQKHFKEIQSKKVSFLNDFYITPWQNWMYEQYTDKNDHIRYRLTSGAETPHWWTAYNKVKHERTSHYQKGKTNYCRANLENLISAMAALFVLEMLFIELLNKDGNINIISSSLFELE